MQKSEVIDRDLINVYFIVIISCVYVFTCIQIKISLLPVFLFNTFLLVFSFSFQVNIYRR